MLWMVIMLPAAPPTAWVATTTSGLMASCSAVENWNNENVRLLTVLLPAMNAPSAPIHGANNGHELPARLEAPSASVIGMLAIPDSLKSVPELMNTRTSGSANSSATAAPASWLPATFQVSAMAGPFIRWMKYVITQTTMNTKPGRYSGCTVWLIPVPRMSSIGMAVVVVRKLVSGSTVRVSTSRAPTRT